MKNVGLFFIKEFDQAGYGGNPTRTAFEVTAAFDILWVEGPTPFPGGCDPTYAFAWALQQIRGLYPELNKAQPAGMGFPYLPYTANFDNEIMLNDISHIKTR